MIPIWNPYIVPIVFIRLKRDFGDIFTQDVAGFFAEVNKKKYLAVVYKEFIDDGFIVTAYFIRKIKLEDEEIVWKKKC